MKENGCKYDFVLGAFTRMMECELHANAHHGDRPGWLKMNREQALLEVFYHLGKLQKAVRDDKMEAIREHGADVANTTMMLLDVCGAFGVSYEHLTINAYEKLAADLKDIPYQAYRLDVGSHGFNFHEIAGMADQGSFEIFHDVDGVAHRVWVVKNVVPKTTEWD